MKTMKKLMSLLLCAALLAVLAGCGTAPAETEPPVAEIPADGSVLGEGATSFTFVIVDVEGNETTYTINTDETTVGAALLALDLIAGEDGDYGLYVKTVIGKTLDFEKDGKYWAFYIDGEYGMTGIDQTDIVAGSTYTMKAE